MNGTHYFFITVQPAMVTNTVRIIPSNIEKRACFKLEMRGCDPTGTRVTFLHGKEQLYFSHYFM